MNSAFPSRGTPGEAHASATAAPSLPHVPSYSPTRLPDGASPSPAPSSSALSSSAPSPYTSSPNDEGTIRDHSEATAAPIWQRSERDQAETLARESEFEWRPWLTRVASGFGLAAIYGAALGSRAGGFSLLRHAVAVPLGLLGVSAVGLFALLVSLSLLDAQSSPGQILSAAARSISSTGLILAGIAPATALLVVTIREAGAAQAVAAGGLLLAAAVGILPALKVTYRALSPEAWPFTLRAPLFVTGFAVFSFALGARLFFSLLPVLAGGAS
ncbi:MAG TPA: hypothetical protein VFQ61_31070 [Polyangiaceae bacterium]|nr:hypothetical protein [Polyangiaceae bacterium]